MTGTLLQLFTIGNTAGNVWILNSGVHIDDMPFFAGGGDDPDKKAKGTGYRWMAMPLPFDHASSRNRGWHVEQAVLSSFQRIKLKV